MGGCPREGEALANPAQCCPGAARLAQHPPQVSAVNHLYQFNADMPRRNSVDKRTVIENYDLVVGPTKPRLTACTCFPLTLPVARRRRARRRWHHPRDRPCHRRLARQQAARAGHDLDEEHRPFGAGPDEHVGLWKEAAGRADTTGAVSGILEGHGVAGVLNGMERQNEHSSWHIPRLQLA